MQEDELHREPGILADHEIKIDYGPGVDESVKLQGRVFLYALMIYQDRNKLYKDNWRRYGWRGLLYDLRRKVERAWDALWDERPSGGDTDDLIDCVNYAALAARAVQEQNRDGTGGWW